MLRFNGTWKIDIDNASKWDTATKAYIPDAVGEEIITIRVEDGVQDYEVLYGDDMADTELATFRRVVDVNLTGLHAARKATAPFLLEAGQSTIVNIASGVAIRPFAGSSAYAASKGGVLTLTRVLAQELAPKVRVNSVCPGAVDTPMAMPIYTSNSMKQEIASRYSLQRTGQPPELAQAILFLTAASSSFVTGIALPVDGGRTFH